MLRNIDTVGLLEHKVRLIAFWGVYATMFSVNSNFLFHDDLWMFVPLKRIGIYPVFSSYNLYEQKGILIVL